MERKKWDGKIHISTMPNVRHWTGIGGCNPSTRLAPLPFLFESVIMQTQTVILTNSCILKRQLNQFTEIKGTVLDQFVL